MTADIGLFDIFNECFAKSKFDLAKVSTYPRLCTITPRYSFVPDSPVQGEEHFADRDSALLCVVCSVCVCKGERVMTGQCHRTGLH